MMRQVLSSLRSDIGLDSSASTFRIALSQGFLYHCFTCRRDGREPHGSRPASLDQLDRLQVRVLRLVKATYYPASAQSALSGWSPTSRLWTGLHRLMTTKDMLNNYFSNRWMK